MPNIKSAKKRVLVTKTKAARNKALKSNLKTVLKEAHLALDNNAENKVDVVKFATKKIDQACAKGLLHKNNAARKKSQLAEKLNATNA